MTGVRWREDTGFQGKCDYCLEWWPIDAEFWKLTKQAFRMCKACINDYKRLKQAERRQDPDKRAIDREGVNAQRKALMRAGIMGEYRARWYRQNAERIRASRREKYAAQRAAEGKPYTPRTSTSSVLTQLRKRAA